MKLFDVYGKLNLCPVKGKGAYIWDDQDQKYLDLYSGHGVVSIGHAHPTYVQAIQAQVAQIGFYSNAIQNPLQQQAADLLEDVSGVSGYELFFTNSGAESNENALKIASFVTGRNKVLAFKNGFHGRTSAAVAITDNKKIQAPINLGLEVALETIGDTEAVAMRLRSSEYAAVVIEGIQGIGGAQTISNEYLQFLQQICQETGTLLVLDEVQSGFGRSGKFFAYQHADIAPDIVTMAKGMGNGFPVGGILVHERHKAWKGMLGSTFGGNHLACAAVIAVLTVLKSEQLVNNAQEVGNWLQASLTQLPELKKVTGKGLLLGLYLTENSAQLRNELLHQHQIITGSATDPTCMRILPPLNITKQDLIPFVATLKTTLNHEKVHIR